MTPAIIGGAILLLLLGYFWFLKNFLFICGPDEVLVFSGRKRETGQDISGFRVVFSGRSYKWPIIETVDRMDLKIFPVHIQLDGALSRGNIPLSVHAIANVKITSEEQLVGNAIERFLGRHDSEVQRVAKETLEGNLRGILATMTPEEVNEDRLTFAARLAEDAEEDLRKLGLHLDTLKIQSVHDQVEYLDSIGRKRVAEVLRDAEISESDAKREAKSAEANAQAAGQVALENANARIKEKQNELRRIRAELVARVKSEQETATGNAETARSQAAQALESVRINLEGLRLQAEQVIPAEINRESAELIAAGKAAPIEARAEATAEALRQLNDAWSEAGDSAMDIFVMQQVERIMLQVAQAARQVTLENVALIDSGSGDTLPAYVSAYPRVVGALLNELKETIGLDVAGAIAGNGRLGRGGNGASKTNTGSGGSGGGGKSPLDALRKKEPNTEKRNTMQMPRVPTDD